MANETKTTKVAAKKSAAQFVRDWLGDIKDWRSKGYGDFQAACKRGDIKSSSFYNAKSTMMNGSPKKKNGVKKAAVKLADMRSKGTIPDSILQLRAQLRKDDVSKIEACRELLKVYPKATRADAERLLRTPIVSSTLSTAKKKRTVKKTHNKRKAAHNKTANKDQNKRNVRRVSGSYKPKSPKNTRSGGVAKTRGRKTGRKVQVGSAGNTKKRGTGIKRRAGIGAGATVKVVASLEAENLYLRWRLQGMQHGYVDRLLDDISEGR